MKYVLLYQPAANVMELAPIHFPAHRKLADEYHAAGTLTHLGTFADPREGAMAVFTTREAAEEFVSRDPFVANGVVSGYSLKEWREVYS